jgi:hypothetical protein
MPNLLKVWSYREVEYPSLPVSDSKRLASEVAYAAVARR